MAQFAERSAAALRSGAKLDLLLNAPLPGPQRIPEAHIALGHVVCALIEQ
jgi:hypothetical protein